MTQNYKKFFSLIGEENPKSGLLERIFLLINKEKLRKARIRLFCFGALGVFSIIGLIPAWQMVVDEVNTSGFAKFLSLMLSDPAIIATYWSEFLVLLAESLPALGIGMFLASIFALLFALRFLARDINIIWHRSKPLRYSQV